MTRRHTVHQHTDQPWRHSFAPRRTGDSGRFWVDDEVEIPTALRTALRRGTLITYDDSRLQTGALRSTSCTSQRGCRRGCFPNEGRDFGRVRRTAHSFRASSSSQRFGWYVWRGCHHDFTLETSIRSDDQFRKIEFQALEPDTDAQLHKERMITVIAFKLMKYFTQASYNITGRKNGANMCITPEQSIFRTKPLQNN